MLHRMATWALASALWLTFASCFSPRIPEGLPCGEDGECPPGQDCDLPSGQCRPAGSDTCSEPPCPAVVADFYSEPVRDLDLLFMIDNSGSMIEEQTSLAQNFQRFVNVLNELEGGLPNLHVGVISSDVGAGPYNISGCAGNGDNGALQSTPQGACDPPSGAYISDVDDGTGGRTRNYAGTLADTFSCIARLGIDGCGFEQPLESMRRALDGSNPSNAGFLRPQAILGVFFVADEDDCSVSDTGVFDTSQNSISDPLGPLSSFRCFEFGVVCDEDDPRTPGAKDNCRPREDSAYLYPVDEYVDFLKSLKDDPNKIVVAGIVGNPTPVSVRISEQQFPDLEPSCVSAAGEADPAVRLAAFLEGFPQRNTLTTICNDDLSDALVLIAGLLTRVSSVPCVEGDIDIVPTLAGVQYECSAVEIRDPGGSDEEIPLAECSSASPDPGELPCWRLQEELASCSSTTTHMRVVVVRDTSAPPGSRVELTCRVF